MFWTIIDRVVNLTFLLLAFVIIGTLLSNSNTDKKEEVFALEVAALRQDFRRVMDNNIAYVEKRVNGLSQTQDEYQVSTSNRLGIVEDRLKRLEKENKDLKQQQKNVITQTNTQIVNGERKNN
jgi:hypothetical protein